MSQTVSHHNEWKSLIDISGPFLSLPVLLEVFPNGLDIVDTEIVSNLRSAYEEWLEDRKDVAIHSAWIGYVLRELLGFPADLLVRGQAISSNISTYIPQQAISLRPSMVLVDPSTKEPRLLIQKYDYTQKMDRPPNGEASMTCLSRMMELLHATQVPLGLVTNGEDWVLVHAPVGETSSYITFYSHLWFSERLTLNAFFTLLKLGRFFGVPDEDILVSLFKRSAENQHEITDQLGSQVRSAVQILIQALNKADQDSNRKLLKDLSPDLLYEAAITVMMRLVFLLYAEERKLLPITESVYDEHYAISTLADQLRSEGDRVGEDVLERHYDAWSRILAVSRMIFGGIHHDRLNMPAYGGSLFDPDRFAFLEGRSQGTSWQVDPARPLLIDNRTILHILDNIQFLYIREYSQRQRLSFRALDIEQIGHIYEGLLEYKAARANEIMVGLDGNKDYPLPFITLDELEQLYQKGIKDFAKGIKDLTGKSTTAIKNRTNKEIDLTLSTRLRTACQNNDNLYQRMAPFAHLLREDDYQNLVIVEPGSIYVTLGSTRRATGTHYTPKSLTEPIVQHTLEPLVYHGPAEGLPQEEWTLNSPAELLDLKICDMAMGSGSFLVQVIRYLSERLVESWQKLVPVSKPDELPNLYISPEGKVLDKPSGGEIPNDLDARHLVARRLIADRCIYGVDKNHLAVEMAKLSIWLITLDKNRPFTFLNHSLKCGDSLVGVDEKDFLNWAHGSVKNPTPSLFDEKIKKELEIARGKRRELEAFEVNDISDLLIKEELLQQSKEAVERVKLGCDLLVGAQLQAMKTQDQEAEESFLLMQWMAGEIDDSNRCQNALEKSKLVKAFHWFLEFPEVFDKAGFDCFVGNPPFLHGRRISTIFGSNYLEYLKGYHSDVNGSSDLISYFLLRMFKYVKRDGIFGFIATQGIARGVTRQSSLGWVEKNSGYIYFAYPNIAWPGSAAVRIAVIIIIKNRKPKLVFLNDEPVNHISSFLTKVTGEKILEKPKELSANNNLCSTGTYVYGKGFVLTNDEMNNFVSEDQRNSQRIKPFLRGVDINTHPEHKNSCWVIDFDDFTEDKAREWPILFQHLERTVKLQRSKQTKQIHESCFWKHWDKREELYLELNKIDECIVHSFTSKYVQFAIVKTNQIIATPHVIFPTEDKAFFGVLQSTFHNVWVVYFSSKLKVDIRYTPTDCVYTFPFPKDFKIVGSFAKDYINLRQNIMAQENEGLTKIYNRFHDPKASGSDIRLLRKKHIEMDKAVASSYGWDDLNLDSEFQDTTRGKRFTVSDETKTEILSRLFELNNQRFLEEELETKKESRTRKNAIINRDFNKHSQPDNVDQMRFELEEEPLSSKKLEIASRPSEAISIDQLERWKWYRCLSCGAAVMGFNAKDHIIEKHGNIDVGFALPKSKQE